MIFHLQMLSKILPTVLNHRWINVHNILRQTTILSQSTRTLCFYNITSNKILLNDDSKKCILTSLPKRHKSFKNFKGKKKSNEYESDSDSDSDDIPQEPGSKVVQIQSDSLRCDLILKNGLGIPRNKLELLFYEGRFRMNGKKVLKRNVSVGLGDEIDIIKNINEENPDLINVGRVEILKIRPSGDYVSLTVRKYKNLLISNYEEDPWKEIPKESDEELSEKKKE